ncbi:MAG: permease DsdX [Verrucomicrobia bacterium]|nr:permease DsdX [Verrucomicrobiota bacterium]MBI3869655.1 permease DsdX [Verrucomicrobiota bacterium]
MTATDWKLILLAVLAVAGLVLWVTRLKINPFISLALASLVVGAGTILMGIPTVANAAKPGEKSVILLTAVVKAFGEGMGATLGGIAAVIGLGTMLGKLLAESGGAEVLSKSFSRFFGPKRVIWCVMALALTVGLTTWFAVGLVLLLPILLTLTRETKQPFLALAIPLLSCLSVMHGVMPPHPGPVVAVDALKANNGYVLLWGFVIGIPTAAIAGPIFARWAVKHVTAEPPDIPVKEGRLRPGLSLPGFGLTLFSILLPVLLMLLATVAELTLEKGSPVREALGFVGNATIALLISVLFASWSLGTRCGYAKSEILKFTEQSIAAVGMTLLVVGGGGGFARVLKDCGVADALAAIAKGAHLSPLLYGWLMAAFVRVATGSATVSITTAANLLAPALVGDTTTNRELIVVAIGCGSLFLSHLNDGGFWIVKDCLGLSVGQTLKTWTRTETIVGIVGMLISYVISLFVHG